ncbi:MAG: hypothetical protein LBQ06_06575, partial [Frankiaceae bacterium]|nr:hypothetical protein [Frankiaceae bacterium]
WWRVRPAPAPGEAGRPAASAAAQLGEALREQSDLLAGEVLAVEVRELPDGAEPDAAALGGAGAGSWSDEELGLALWLLRA